MYIKEDESNIPVSLDFSEGHYFLQTLKVSS